MIQIDLYSATAVAVGDRQIGKYYNFKRQRYGLFLSQVYKRWVLPDLLAGMNESDPIELVGDATFFEDMVEAYVNGWLVDNYIKVVALQMSQNPDTETPTSETYDQLKELKKQEILSNPIKNYLYILGIILATYIFKRFVSRFFASIIYTWIDKKNHSELRKSHVHRLVVPIEQFLLFLVKKNHE